MKSKPFRHNKTLDEGKAFQDEILNKLFTQAKAQFGNAIKAFSVA